MPKRLYQPRERRPVTLTIGDGVLFNGQSEKFRQSPTNQTSVVGCDLFRLPRPTPLSYESFQRPTHSITINDTVQLPHTKLSTYTLRRWSFLTLRGRSTNRHVVYRHVPSPSHLVPREKVVSLGP